MLGFDAVVVIDRRAIIADQLHLCVRSPGWRRHFHDAFGVHAFEIDGALLRGVRRVARPGEEAKIVRGNSRVLARRTGGDQNAVRDRFDAADAPAAQVQFDWGTKPGRAKRPATNGKGMEIGHREDQGRGALGWRNERGAKAEPGHVAAAGGHGETFDVEAIGGFRVDAFCSAGCKAVVVAAFAVEIANIPID